MMKGNLDMANNREDQKEAFRKKNEKRKAARDPMIREANQAMGDYLRLGLYNARRFDIQQKAKRERLAEIEARKCKNLNGPRGNRNPNKAQRA